MRLVRFAANLDLSRREQLICASVRCFLVSAGSWPLPEQKNHLLVRNIGERLAKFLPQRGGLFGDRRAQFGKGVEDLLLDSARIFDRAPHLRIRHRCEVKIF
ncbi:MAG TPA: hypothetical protein VH816_17885 [Gaiellaceae bacterium]